MNRQMPDEANDEQRQIDAARRDPNAFAPLYSAYFDPIYRYCYLRLRHRESAADAASQTFLKAFTGIGGFRSGSFKSWLYAIARNVTSDILRASRPQFDLSHAELIADNAPSPEEQALHADDRDRLWQALSLLTAEQREVMELRLAGLTGAEIAEVTRRNVAATKSLQFRALARLRTILETPMFTDGEAV
ncbi:MAG: sigma-70 family RNA polymerase sigma factor [Thermomicrobiales bacterium]|nr:sigma-70 family RNA polymerase sigma factor [Thermomicrobiales bacterium]